MNKKVGVLSDLHLEASNMEIQNPGWDVLVLAGDISSDFSLLDRFFTYQCPQDIPIIYVPGNHEYEGKVKEDVINQLKDVLKDFPHVHVLQNETIILEGIKFIGTTLWSNFEGAGYQDKEEVKKWAKTNVVDFFKIYLKQDNNKYRPWTPDEMEKEFRKSYDFLSYELKQNPFEGPKFVVTHFAPTPDSSHPKFKKDMMRAYWANDVSNLMGFSDYWHHGHTHDTFSYNKEGTQVICNPRGYSHLFNLAQNEKFNKTMALNVEVPESVKKFTP